MIGVRTDISGLLVDYRRSFSFQEFYDFLCIFGFHPDFCQGRVKMLQEQVKVRVIQTMISGSGMDFMKIFPGIHTPAQYHGDEHNLPRAQVRHVYSFKIMAQFLILRNFLVEQFRGSGNRFTSPDQLVKVFSHSLPKNQPSDLEQTLTYCSQNNMPASGTSSTTASGLDNQAWCPILNVAHWATFRVGNCSPKALRPSFGQSSQKACITSPTFARAIASNPATYAEFDSP
jgi:hypothetical protein